MPIFVQIAIAIALAVVSYLIMPKPKAPKPEAVKDLDNPTAEAGRPKPVVFGSITVKGLNFLWSGDKGKSTYKVDS
jgi:hypothetical protein